MADQGLLHGRSQARPVTQYTPTLLKETDRRRKKEYDFKSWMGPGPISENRPRMGSGNEAKHGKSLPNGRQQGGAFGAAPLGFCCLPIGKDFLRFASFLQPILGRFSEFGPGPIQDLKSCSFCLLTGLVLT